MKNLFYFLVFISAPFLLSAQENWASYSIALNTAGYEGKPFRLEAAIRAEITDDSASARLWARVDKEKGWGFFENMWEKPIRNKAWKVYTIEGTIDTGSQQLAFGALTQYNGSFFFDDVKLSIETKKGQWTTVFQDGFEADGTGDWKRGVRRWEENSYGINELFQIEPSKTNPASGKQCLKITSSSVPIFGINDKAGKYLDVNFIKLYCEVYGEGQPLVMLLTGSMTIGDATPFIPEFAKKYKVIAFDNRGQGKSGDTDAALTYELMADDIAKALDKLGIDSTYIYGFSDGAIMGLLLAMEHPRLVKKLLADAPYVLPDSAAFHSAILQFYQKQLDDPSATPKVRRWLYFTMTQPNIPFEKLAAVECPVLVLSGDRDVVKLEHTVKVFQSIPRSQLCVIPGARQNAVWDNRDFFLRLAGDFFEKPFAMPSTLDLVRE